MSSATSLITPGGRREQAKEARRHEILEAGYAEFTRLGFTATRLEDVAAKAGVGKGTIYLYFDSKEKLFEAVVREHMTAPADLIRDRVANFEGSTPELLRHHLTCIYQGIRNERIPPLIAMVLGEGNRFPNLSEFFFKEMISANQQVMQSIIRRGIDRGEFRDTDVARYTQIIIAPVIFSALWRLQFEAHFPIDPDAYAQAHIDMILNGLVVKD